MIRIRKFDPGYPKLFRIIWGGRYSYHTIIRLDIFNTAYYIMHITKKQQQKYLDDLGYGGS